MCRWRSIWPRTGASMTRRPRHHHTLAFKAKVALTVIKREKPPSEFAQQLEVQANKIMIAASFWKTLPMYLSDTAAQGRRYRLCTSRRCTHPSLDRMRPDEVYFNALVQIPAEEHQSQTPLSEAPAALQATRATTLYLRYAAHGVR